VSTIPLFEKIIHYQKIKLNKRNNFISYIVFIFSHAKILYIQIYQLIFITLSIILFLQYLVIKYQSYSTK